MIRSMTGFARQESEGDWGNLTLELRSVNSRYLETHLRLPDELRSLEPPFRAAISERLGRGKVECQLRFQPPTDRGELTVDLELAGKLAHASREVDGLLYNAAPISSLEVLKWPGVMKGAEVDSDTLHAAAIELLATAIDELTETRGREGEKLKGIILQRCDGIEQVVAAVKTRLPEVLAASRERLRTRLAEMLAELDPQRVEQEMVLVAQKLDVDEEMDRLQTHVDEVRRVLEQKKPVGRRLDFLMQELNREANTLGSKSADSETTRASVDLKVLIEQMREQIQNIE